MFLLKIKLVLFVIVSYVQCNTDLDDIKKSLSIIQQKLQSIDDLDQLKIDFEVEKIKIDSNFNDIQYIKSREVISQDVISEIHRNMITKNDVKELIIEIASDLKDDYDAKIQTLNTGKSKTLCFSTFILDSK